MKPGLREALKEWLKIRQDETTQGDRVEEAKTSLVAIQQKRQEVYEKIRTNADLGETEGCQRLVHLGGTLFILVRGAAGSVAIETAVPDGDPIEGAPKRGRPAKPEKAEK